MKFEKEIQELDDASLLELYRKIQEHIQYLKNSIIITGEDESNE